tara:strand:+ start:292 stop:480 length:189 start_codon:yes stop_codon:yes gene_type:complete
MRKIKKNKKVRSFKLKTVEPVKRTKTGFFSMLYYAMIDNRLEYTIGNYLMIVKPFSLTIKKK